MVQPADRSSRGDTASQPPAVLDNTCEGERPYDLPWAAGQPGPHGTSPARSGPCAGATARGPGTPATRFGSAEIRVARVEAVTMTPAEYGTAVEAIAVLIARYWDDNPDAEAA